MKPAPLKQKDIILKTLLGSGVIVFIIIMITHPAVIFQGSLAGINAWWNIVFPSLLPFFIATELLIGLGIVNFMGVLLEPVMRPLFNVPGAGSFAVAIGFTSGNPAGAMVTGRLRREKLCTRIEAERLLSFTNNSGPLFMVVAISVGMFNNPALGPVIAGGHYLGNITLGFALRYYGKNDPEKLEPVILSHENILRKAWREMTAVLEKEKRPTGKIINDAVKNSVNSLLNIGGFIVLFAVIIRLLTELGLISIIAGAAGCIFTFMGDNKETMEAAASGLFEMTMGAKLASETSAPLVQQVLAVSAILGWSGLSIFAQVSSMIANTDIRLTPFIIARFFHAMLACFYTFILFKFLDPLSRAGNFISGENIYSSSNWIIKLHFIKTGLLYTLTICAVLGVLSMLIYFSKKIIN